MAGKDMIRSIVFLPTEISDTHRWVMTCAQYCASRRYEVVAVVHAWPDVIKYLAEGRATVLVIGTRRHLPVGREPRLEVVTEQHTVQESSARRRPKRRQLVRRQVP